VIRLDDGELSKAGRKLVRGRKREIDHRLRALIESGVADGSIAACDAKIAAFILAGSIHGMASWYEPAGPTDLATITEQYVQMLSAGLAVGSMPGINGRANAELSRAG
jgi:hypothetical protein